ncbi:MAG TPA: S41 family peptidase [Puia sp.]|uniref:S41 family peptidase n=1 Tax=Puia sp. TaxID=2045100 RepID=UPI002CE668DA|nr:S41 family peptidase [Puia sp.]HVU98628.1 S41 family peptidase [Puia sp.]
MKNAALVFCLLAALAAHPQSFTTAQYKEDFQWFWQTVNDNYCYFQKKKIDWNRIREFYRPRIDTVTTRESFIALLEDALYELYDHHCTLRTRNPFSRRLVPTGADIWAEWEGEKAVVREVRKGFGAGRVGIRAGMEIVAVDDVPVNQAILPFLPHTVNRESRSFALRLLMAGDHVHARKMTLKSGGATADYYPDKDGLLLEDVQYPAWVESASYGPIGYIRINNFLYDNNLIARFDSVLNGMLDKPALMIDLRETPSGGNTTVARAILGRFIRKDHFYQKHELYAEEKATGVKRSWEEIVSPRGICYTGRVVVLADHWTGSIAEGITIAFDGMKRATVIGTELARLNGAVDGFELPVTKIGFNIATERLYHVDGTPRELFEPAITVDVRGQSAAKDGDVILNTALGYLRRQLK